MVEAARRAKSLRRRMVTWLLAFSALISVLVFEVDDLDVTLGVDAVGYVDDVLILEAAHHVGDGIGLADVGEELVAQAFTLGGARHQAGDVDELHGGR